jgi:hypothetical protein
MKKNLILLFAIIPICLEALSQNVGIGTSAPIRKLHVHNGASVFSGIMLSTDATGLTTNDGLQIGIQYQADNVNNRYAYLLSEEEIPIFMGTNGRTNDVRVLANGNVGIGLSDPGQRLEISGNIRLRGAGTTNKRLIFRLDNNSGDMGSIGHLNDEVISIADHTSGAQSSKFYFDVVNEKLGIGALPGANDGKILVNYNSSTTNPHLTLRESQTGDYGRLEFANTGTTRTWHIAGQVAVGTGTTGRENDILNIWNSGRGDIMTFRGDGRVGILTTTPATGYALSVNGRIICEELRVQLSGSWPDYVFADNYNLPSISQLEKYIQQNKHLPGIPQATLLEKEGIAIGDMQKRMMEKIEELTLYIIQQQKEIDALKLKVN